MKIRKGCLLTECVERQEKESDQCYACLQACSYASYDCDSSTACEFSCRESKPCSDWENDHCAEEGYEVTLPNNPSAEVQAACQRELDHIHDCGYDAPLNCSLFAAIEMPNVAPQYDCAASLSCEELTTTKLQSCSLPPTTFGTEVCTAMSEICGDYCSADLLEELNAEGAWYRADVRAAAVKCTKQAGCEDAASCLNAWKAAVGLSGV